MATDHDGVRELLAAWAVGALLPGDEKAVPLHLAECESCAAEAERLRETVRLLGGPASGPRLNGAGGAAGGVLAAALRARPRVARVAPHAAPYAAAVAGLQALVREMEGRWATPVVHDWNAHATVAHLLAADEPLALRLGLDARVPASPVPGDTPWEDAWNARTADVIAHELTRAPEDTVAAWAAQAAELLATPEALDSVRAAHATTLMGLRLPVADHFLVRAFETWIHTDDLGRALGLPVPPPPEEHLGLLVRLAVRVLQLALSSAPPVLLAMAGAEPDAQWVLGSEDEPVQAELVLDPVDFCLLLGGRYEPDAVPRGATGDEGAVQRVLQTAAAMSWL
ncbi:maleylpyruvate isomerase family mycothiol-dependent enzyme [Streptomyces spongiae]|uniref:Maleylpyruvate isomerase family mycothiol-dependent enzyme n=1 Tax=Streptomyces spongiae TaxID=565072 RepID=A0A5N8XV13_9ACTN|nr:maleylpyruvate isomerase family mycothiol-dependent enzyme [Streptomyces spongiae]MPY62898.1 maleylpyruvate isomerase family mycothiol-dependent enzyme [Streptomyces spongiae]